jgi:hypothetical protein
MTCAPGAHRRQDPLGVRGSVEHHNAWGTGTGPDRAYQLRKPTLMGSRIQQQDFRPVSLHFIDENGCAVQRRNFEHHTHRKILKG